MPERKILALVLGSVIILSILAGYFLLHTPESHETAPLTQPVRTWVDVTDGNAKLFIDGKPADLIGFFATSEVEEYIDKTAQYKLTFCIVRHGWLFIDKVTITFAKENPQIISRIKELNRAGRLREAIDLLPEFDVPKNAAELIDFETIDNTFNYAAEKGVRLIYGVRLFDPPIWWVKNFPDHLQHNSTGGLALMPTFNSPEFLKYADQVLTAIIKRYRNHPALLGWALVFGWTSENNYPGGGYYCSWGIYDYSPIAIERFREWLREKYEGDVEKLRSAWGNATVTFENAVPPTPLPPPENLIEFINGPGDNRSQWLDWMKFRLHEKKECMLHFANLIKELDPNHVLIQTPGAVLPGVGALSNIITMAIDAYIFVKSPVDIVYVNPGLDERAVQAIKLLGYPPFLRYYETRGKAAFIKWEGRPGVDYDANPELITYVAKLARETGTGLAIWGGHVPMPGTWEEQPEFTDEQISLFVETFRNTPEGGFRDAKVAILTDPRLSFYLYYVNQPYKLLDVAGLLALMHKINVECDIIHADEVYEDPSILEKYQIIILDNLFRMSDQLVDILVNYRDRGKCLFLIGRTGVYGDAQTQKFEMLKKLLGIDCEIKDFKITNYSWRFTDAEDELLNGIKGALGDIESELNMLYIPYFDYDSEGYVKLGVLESNTSIATVVRKGNIICWFPRLGLQLIDRGDNLENVLKFLKNLCNEFGAETCRSAENIRKSYNTYSSHTTIHKASNHEYPVQKEKLYSSIYIMVQEIENIF